MKMSKFRKKPVVIEAFKVKDAIVAAQDSWRSLPRWLVDHYEAGNVLFTDKYISISTLEGTMRAELEDWIICGVNGEIYPCKPDIFDKTYEKVEE
jgi:hypothetical protein